MPMRLSIVYCPGRQVARTQTRPGQARPIGLILSPLLSGVVGRRGSAGLIDLATALSLSAASLNLSEEGSGLNQTDCSIRKSSLDSTVDRMAIEIQCLSSSNLPTHRRRIRIIYLVTPVSHIMVSMSNCIAMCTGRAGGRARAIQCNIAGRLMRLQNIGAHPQALPSSLWRAIAGHH